MNAKRPPQGAAPPLAQEQADPQAHSGRALRQRAVEALRTQGAQSPDNLDALSPEAARQMLHELHVHQIELEMQNEELRLSQAALAASRARYFDLYELAPVGYCTLSENGLILEANLTAATLLGRARLALARQPWTRFILDQDQDIYYLARKRLIATGEPQSCELRLVKQDGTQYWAHLVVTAAQGEGGTATMRLVLSDVTERRQAEASRASLEEQLREAQKMESVGRLAGGIAHDFNNLLTIVSGAAELAEIKLHKGAPVTKELAAIRRAGAKAAIVTRQLLAYGRQQVLRPTIVDLNPIVRDLETLLQRTIGDRISIALDLDDDLAPVTIDAGQFEQVLLNLAINSRDAMPQDGQLTIQTRNVLLDDTYATAHPTVRPGPHVLITISDSGIGMDETTQQKIFEPFFTTKETTSRAGLGLAMVHGIVRQSGGDIQVSSTVSQGTAITICLPRAQGEVPGSRVAPPEPAVAHGVETLLVVEDDDAVREMVRGVLVEVGYTVHVAVNGQEALAVLAREPQPIALVVTDLVMPVMGGRALAARLAISHSATKILFMSAYADQADAAFMTAGREQFFIRKPFAVADLTRQVRLALDS